MFEYPNLNLLVIYHQLGFRILRNLTLRRMIELTHIQGIRIESFGRNLAIVVRRRVVYRDHPEQFPFVKIPLDIAVSAVRGNAAAVITYESMAGQMIVQRIPQCQVARSVT